MPTVGGRLNGARPLPRVSSPAAPPLSSAWSRGVRAPGYVKTPAAGVPALAYRARGGRGRCSTVDLSGFSHPNQLPDPAGDQEGRDLPRRNSRARSIIPFSGAPTEGEMGPNWPPATRPAALIGRRSLRGPRGVRYPGREKMSAKTVRQKPVSALRSWRCPCVFWARAAGNSHPFPPEDHQATARISRAFTPVFSQREQHLRRQVWIYDGFAGTRRSPTRFDAHEGSPRRPSPEDTRSDAAKKVGEASRKLFFLGKGIKESSSIRNGTSTTGARPRSPFQFRPTASLRAGLQVLSRD